MRIHIPKEVEKALNILHTNNFEAYIVGGCVRDSILGLSPSDWDITTSAKPEEICESFHKFRTIETGLKHGTITVIIDKMNIEITTYRIDGEYSDNRRPDNVIFTEKVELDLKRRDFTINSIAYDGKELVDLFGGKKDINNKVIRCVGNPDERFNEDGLRILRALRFASVLNFSIEDNTSKSIHKNKELLNNISKERINIEFNKLIMGENFQEIFEKYIDVLWIFIPELNALSMEELKYRLNAMNSLNDLISRLSVLLYQVDAQDILLGLKYDNHTIRTVKLLTSNIDKKIYPDYVNMKRWLNNINYVNLYNLINIKKELFKTENENLKKSEKIIDDIIETNQCYNLEKLVINGSDLINLGIPKGEIIGKTLNEILNEVIEGKLANNKDSLHNYIYVNMDRLLL